MWIDKYSQIPIEIQYAESYAQTTTKVYFLIERNLSNDGQQFHQYQQSEQPHGVENLGPDLQQAN